MEEAVAIDQVIQKNFSKPAIVVTVADKRKGVSARDRVPAKIGPYPIDIRQASLVHPAGGTDSCSSGGKGSRETAAEASCATGSRFSITIGRTWPILRAWTEFLTRTRNL